ncbi:MAG: MAPEG family protein [Pseudomonadota bacterium]
MEPLSITALYGGLLALVYLWLTAMVVRHRRSKRISLGDGGDHAVEKSIRGQGNAAEQIPIAVIVMGLAEVMGTSPIALHIAGLMLLIGRIAHGAHFNGLIGFQWRPRGMVLTLAATAYLAIEAVIRSTLSLI